MKKGITILMMTMCAINLFAQKWADDPANRFAVTVRIDSAIASEPQKMYMYSMVEREMQLHDSISFDSVHRVGTMHGSVPYEYNVNLLLQRRGPKCVPIVVKGGDSLSIHIGDEDDGFRLRYINKVEGSPSTLEMVHYEQKLDSLRSEYTKQRGMMQIYNLTDEQRDSIKVLMKKADDIYQRYKLEYACTGKSPYLVVDAAHNVFYAFRKNPTLHPYTEKEVDDMMNSLLVRFPDYPPMKALVNDSTIGNYMSAQSFEVWGELQLRMYSDRFKKDDTIKVKPLKVGDYINIDPYDLGYSSVNMYRGKYLLVDFWASWCQPCMVQIPNIRYAAQEFRDDLVVYMIGMDENRKKWWSTIKEMDLRKKDLSQTDRPYEIQHSWAYDDKKGTLLPGFKRLDIKTIPHNYLVDRSGRIIAKNISITLAIDKLKAAIKQEQNGACSDSAEREQARTKFKALLEKEKQQ